jgi:hypothetical protein
MEKLNRALSHPASVWVAFAVIGVVEWVTTGSPRVLAAVGGAALLWYVLTMFVRAANERPGRQ